MTCGGDNKNLVGVSPHWDAEGAREAEVGELEHAVAVDEEVLRLQVAVQHAVCMAERDPLVPSMCSVSTKRVRRSSGDGGGAHRPGASGRGRI